MTIPATAFGPGALAVTVVVASAAGGRVEAVHIASTRPVGFSSALFLNRPADEVPGLVGRLHSLCGLSHATASTAAIAAARGEDGLAVATARFDGLLAERLGEHLRSTFLGPAGNPTADGQREALADLRAVLAATRELVAAVDAPIDPARRRTAIAGIRGATERLGLVLDGRDRPWWPAASWADGVLRRAETRDGPAPIPVDRLSRDDDAEVIAALAADPIGFAATPRLGTRRPETGPFARAPGAEPADERARTAARLAEIARAAAILEEMPEARRRELADWASAGPLGEATGYAAVESPRGRLHHLVRLDAAGRIAAYAILAPTEWNFGPDGPFVAALRADRLTADAAGRARVERIAAAFDPCVGFAVTVEDRDRA